MSLGNLRSQEIITAQYNPADLEHTIGVTYTRLGVLGYSSEVLQFQFRPNEKLSFTLSFDRLSSKGGTPSWFYVTSVLGATTLGSRGAQDIASGGPPDVLFLWPGVLQMIVRVTSLKSKATRFASQDGSPTFFTVAVEVEEARTNRLYAEDVRQAGLMRGGQ